MSDLRYRTRIFPILMFALGVVVAVSTSAHAALWNGPTAAPPYNNITLSLLGQWLTSGTNIYYNAGNVGIGGTTPKGTLETFTSGLWSNTEYVTNGIQTSTGHTLGTDYTLYMGADATTHLSYIQSVQWGTSVAPFS